MDEDPVFKVSDLDFKITRVNGLLTRLSSIPKPKEKKKKLPKNFKIDNMTFNGKDGENINIEDFIKYDNGDDTEEEEIPQQQQQQNQQSEDKSNEDNSQDKQDQQKEQTDEEKASTSKTASEDL